MHAGLIAPVIVTSRLSRYILAAQRIAQTSSCDQKHGALIYRGGNIIALAANRKVTHPESERWSDDPKKITTIHAEQRAIILSPSGVYGSTLISVRLNGDGRARPCVMCAALMRDAGIHSVIYYDGNQYVRERLW